jgi:hypothetical protein
VPDQLSQRLLRLSVGAAVPDLCDGVRDLLRRGERGLHCLQRELLPADRPHAVPRQLQRRRVRKRSGECLLAVRGRVRFLHVAGGLPILPERQRHRLLPEWLQLHSGLSLLSVRQAHQQPVHQLRRRLRHLLRRLPYHLLLLQR